MRSRLLLALGRAETKHASMQAQTAADMLCKVVEGVAPSPYSNRAKFARLALHGHDTIAVAKFAFEDAAKRGVALNISTMAFYGVKWADSIHVPQSQEKECFTTFAACAGTDLGFFPLTWVDSVPEGSRYTHQIDGRYFTSIGEAIAGDPCVFDWYVTSGRTRCLCVDGPRLQQGEERY